MTKKQLVDILSQYSDDQLILIPGYESGFNLIGYITSSKIIKLPNPAWYDGEYATSNKGKLKGILLHPTTRE